MINQKRVKALNSQEYKTGSVIYWMSRDQRLNDNWALIYAQKQALELNQSLDIVFTLSPNFLGATLRQYDFMVRGLEELEKISAEKNINFHLILGDPATSLEAFIQENNVGMLVTDFSPLKISRIWKEEIIQVAKIPIYEIDAHNIIPIWEASNKQEFGAYTLRPKIKKLLSVYLTDFPTIRKHPINSEIKKLSINWKHLLDTFSINKDVRPVDWIRPGEKQAQSLLKEFIVEKLARYDENRNDPTKNAQSNLSPYLHFGQLSSQTIVLETNRLFPHESESKNSFFEELIVRKELSDNFCYYNQNYDNTDGFPNWAKQSLSEHAKDMREHIYSLEDFEQSKTHDGLWNAAQKQMVETGKMHGYMRMYWAKKILEWTQSPAEAMKIAIYLNDKYELDGRDPNGYTGIAWSLGGVHDRAWFDRPIFGKIRYMNYNGAKTKFNIDEYIKLVSDGLSY